MSLKMPIAEPIQSDFVTLSGTYFYLGMDTSMNFGGSSPFTIEGWIGFSSLESAAPIFSKAGELIFGLTQEGRLFARRRFWDNPLLSSEVLEPGTWNHVGLTCDGRIWKLFVHGRSHMRLDLDTVAPGASQHSAPQHIGTLKTSSTLSCQIWNLRIWNRAHSDQQMFQAMDSLMVPHNGLLASFFPEVPTASHLQMGKERVASAA